MDGPTNRRYCQQTFMKLLTEAEVREIKEISDTPVTDLLDVYKTCLKMQELCDQEHGLGIAAIQVGVPWRLFLIKGGNAYGYYLNCKYEPIGDEKVVSFEGCLTLKDGEQLRQFQVLRYKKIRLIGQKLIIPELKIIDINEEIDLNESIVFQHEIDHCFLILINDIGKEVLWSR